MYTCDEPLNEWCSPVCNLRCIALGSLWCLLLALALASKLVMHATDLFHNSFCTSAATDEPCDDGDNACAGAG